MLNFTSLFIASLLCVFATLNLALYANAFPDEDWGYVNVDAKNDANLFWWSYGANATQQARDSKPMLIILQGGPGASSFFFDGCEIGPTDFCHFDPPRPRAQSWTQVANLLFVDNPVGTGLSYVRRDAGLARSIEQVADQLVMLLKNVTARHPAVSKMPLYIFGESYGGKHASTFAMHLDMAVKKGELQANLRGVGLGDSWISPADCTASYGSYLNAVSHMDLQEKEKTDSYATQINQALASGKFDLATQLWSAQQQYIIGVTEGINFYNFLRHSYDSDDKVEAYVNNVLKRKYRIVPTDVVFRVSSSRVFNAMKEDFMKPAINQVDYLLANNFNVHVYNGQLDVIVNAPSTDLWIQKLQWPNLKNFLAAKKQSITRGPKVASSAIAQPDLVLPGAAGRSRVSTGTNNPGDLIDDTRLGFVKRYKNLAVWYQLYAGHMAPQDNALMALDMVQRILQQ